MSANNQILIVEHRGRWYVWDNINAESWSDRNEISIKSSIYSSDIKAEAVNFAYCFLEDMEWPDECEYGVVIGKLAKDNAKVIIKEK